MGNPTTTFEWPGGAENVNNSSSAEASPSQQLTTERPLALSLTSLRHIPPPPLAITPVGVPRAPVLNEITRLRHASATLQLHLTDERRRRVESEAKLAALHGEMIESTTLRTQLAAAMAEGRKKDERIGVLETQLAAEREGKQLEEGVLEALKRELEQSHRQAVTIIDSALEAFEKGAGASSGQPVDATCSNVGDREALAGSNDVVAHVPKKSGRPPKKTELGKRGTTDKVKVRVEGATPQPGMKDHQGPTLSNNSVMVLDGDSSRRRDEQPSIARRVAERRSGSRTKVGGENLQTNSMQLPPKKRGRPSKKTTIGAGGEDVGDVGVADAIGNQQEQPAARKRRKSRYGRI